LLLQRQKYGRNDLDNNLIKTFVNQIELAKYLNLNKSTTFAFAPKEAKVSRYLKSGKLLLNKYNIREIK
jgi:hypothetical protein